MSRWRGYTCGVHGPRPGEPAQWFPQTCSKCLVLAHEALHDAVLAYLKETQTKYHSHSEAIAREAVMAELRLNLFPAPPAAAAEGGR